MNLQSSYFAIANPLELLDRWMHGYRHQARVELEGKTLLVEWSARAQRELSRRSSALIVEMQLYFSCVVQKRVLFHEQVEFETRVINPRLSLAFRPIESAHCDPQEFARDHPVGRVLDSVAALKMLPPRLSLDFRLGRWQGEMGYAVAGNKA